jgi:hypothetical protein
VGLHEKQTGREINMKSKRMSVAAIRGVAVLSVALASGPLQAATTTWLGSVSNDWNFGGNWLGFSQPGPTDQASFPSIFSPLNLRTAVNLTANTTVASMTVDGDLEAVGPYSFTRSNNAVLTVNGQTRLGANGSAFSTTTLNGFRLNTHVFSLVSAATGVLTGGAEVTATGIVNLSNTSKLTVSSGTLNATGGVNLFTAGVLQIDSGGTLNMTSGTTMNLEGSTSRLQLNTGFAFSPGTTINTKPGADIVGTSYIDIGNGGANTVNLDGTGTTLTAAGSTVSDWGLGTSGSAVVNLSTSAIANVQRLNIANGSGSASINVYSSSQLNIGQTLTMGGGASGRFIGMSIDGGTVDVTGAATYNAFADTNLISGTLRYRAGATINANARLDITGGTLDTTNQALTINGGTLTHSSNAALSSGSAMVVQAGGTATFTSFFDIGNGNSGALTVTGAGSTLTAGGTSDWGFGSAGGAVVNINNNGVANFTSLRIGNSNGTANVTVATGGQLRPNVLTVGGGSNNRTVNLTINGGTVTLLDVNASNTFNDKAVLNLSSGALDVKGNVTFNAGATANWSGGSFLMGNGKTLALQGGVINRTNTAAGGLSPGATLAINSAGRFDSTGGYSVGELGAGTVNVTGTGSLLRTLGNLTLGGSGSGQVASVTTTAGGGIIVGDNASGFLGDRLVIGDNNPLGSGNGGKLSILNGSTLDHHSRVLIGGLDNTSGEIYIAGTGSLLTVGQDLFIGNASLSNVLVTVESGGKLKIVNEFNFLSNTARLVINTGGTFEANASMLTRTRDTLAQGYNGGNWLGTRGITSATAQTDSRLGVGYVNAGTVLTVKLALKGDTDLNGVVEFPDLLALAQNYTQSNRFWAQGDFDYSGVVEFPDLLALAQNYNGALLTGGSSNHVAATFQADWALAQALVPEPATISLIAGAMGLMSRRVRR